MAYKYVYSIVPAKRNSDLDFTKLKEILVEAEQQINRGIVYRRDGKHMNIPLERMTPQEMIVELDSEQQLRQPARSLSALTRYLTGQYADIFSQYIFNKTLFDFKLLEVVDEDAFVKQESKHQRSLSDMDIMKAVVGLLTYEPESDEDLREKDNLIFEIERLIGKYL